MGLVVVILCVVGEAMTRETLRLLDGANVNTIGVVTLSVKRVQKWSAFTDAGNTPCYVVSMCVSCILPLLKSG